MNSFFIGSIMSSIGFLTVGFVFWGLIAVAGIGFVIALFRRSWKGFLLSGCAFLIPGIVLASQGGSYWLFLLFPLLSFLMAIFIKTTLQKKI